MTFCDSPVLPERTKTRLLELIKRQGPMPAQELAQRLAISVPAARRHLNDLQAQGMLAAQIERPAGRGRPQHVFGLTDQGEGHFSKTYSSLCLDVLRHLENLFGEGAVMRVFDARNAELAAKLKAELPLSMPLAERLPLLIGRLNELGFDAALECVEDTWYLVQRNCPNVLVARQYKELCLSELNMYAEVLGMAVERQVHIACGQAVCRYRLSPL